MWWGAAHIVNACGLGLLSSQGAAPDFVTNDLANALVLLGYGLTWTGARIFDGRNTRPLFVLFAPVLWLALCRIPDFAASASLDTIVVSTMLAVLALLAAEEFWRGRDEPLMSRWPTVVVLLAYTAVLLARVPATLLAQSFGDNSLLSGLSFALLSFGALLFTVVMAFLQLNMTKERTELKHKINSLIDPLSGVANRRAFLDGAAGLLTQQETDHEPLAVLLFDLDHFKQINDPFGHAVGDAVLQNFAATASNMLDGDVLFARIGGEEFASCLPVGDIDEACDCRPGTAELSLGSLALWHRATGAERQRRRYARLRSACERHRSSRHRRPGALPGQGARAQSGRDGSSGGRRDQGGRTLDRTDHRTRSSRRRRTLGRPALAHRFLSRCRAAQAPSHFANPLQKMFQP